MTATLKKELAHILKQVKITSRDGFTIKGNNIKINDMQSADLPHAQPLSHTEKLVGKLQGKLYNLCYTRSIKTPYTNFSPDLSDDTFMETLSKANAGQDQWDVLWQVLSTDSNNGIQAQKGGGTRHFANGHYQLTQAGPDQPVLASVYLPKESRDGQPGFYFAFGNSRERITFPEEYVRIYWHITPEGAKTLVQLITERLNAYEVPFRFKCASHSELYDRSDPAILYFKPPYYQITEVVFFVFLMHSNEHRDGSGTT